MDTPIIGRRPPYSNVKAGVYMNRSDDVSELILKARENPDEADFFIKKYMNFIKSETSKFTKRPVYEHEGDELSIAMFAFYESAMSYSPTRGGFFPYAASAIRNRLIDHYRREKRHTGLIHYDAPADGDDGRNISDTISSKDDHSDYIVSRESARQEISEFTVNLSEFGLSLSDIADNCPKQKRTLEVCQNILNYVKSNPELLDELVKTKKLPVAKLVSATKAERKTIERHRKYIVAVLLAYTNGYEIIRGHLSQRFPSKGGKI